MNVCKIYERFSFIWVSENNKILRIDYYILETKESTLSVAGREK